MIDIITDRNGSKIIRSLDTIEQTIEYYYNLKERIKYGLDHGYIYIVSVKDGNIDVTDKFIKLYNIFVNNKHEYEKHKKLYDNWSERLYNHYVNFSNNGALSQNMILINNRYEYVL
jgi:hypothetical protein